MMGRQQQIIVLDELGEPCVARATSSCFQTACLRIDVQARCLEGYCKFGADGSAVGGPAARLGDQTVVGVQRRERELLALAQRRQRVKQRVRINAAAVGHPDSTRGSEFEMLEERTREHLRRERLRDVSCRCGHRLIRTGRS